MDKGLVVITAPGCGKCKTTKKLLADNGVSVREVDAGTPEGKEIIHQYRLKDAGTVVDTGLCKIVKAQDLIK